MNPVAVIASYWFADMFSAGFEKSPMLAMVIIHLKVGAQKKMVKGPAGCTRSVRMPEGHGRVSTTFWMACTIPRDMIEFKVIISCFKYY